MRTLALLLMAWTCVQAQEAADVLKKVRDTYANMTTVRLVASRTDTVTAGSMSSVASVDYELAEAPGGQVRRAHQIRRRRITGCQRRLNHLESAAEAKALGEDRGGRRRR